MLDRGLAALYQTETKVLSVKRHTIKLLFNLYHDNY